jgi:dTDP-L-rhamnose 4-epimerase
MSIWRAIASRRATFLASRPPLAGAADLAHYPSLERTEDVRVLVTGGAGFIGQHLAQTLIERGVSVTILDNFLPQVHGGAQQLPPPLAQKVQLIVGDVADPAAIEAALHGVERVVHLAAETGTGQSMYEVARYSRTNLQGTAQLFDRIGKMNPKIDRFVIASSRAIYGEGAYQCRQHGVVYPSPRPSHEKKVGRFDPPCPVCQAECVPTATPETAPPQPLSFYGMTKLTQEQMALFFGRVFDIPTLALRYQNVFGPGQSLQNPYTGILAIFSNLARAGQPINVFEDGLESRDFVYVADVVTATAQAVLAPLEGCHSLNIGSGIRTTVLEVAQKINSRFGGQSTVRVSGAFREGDIRHCYADLNGAARLLGYKPEWSFDAGLAKFLDWALESHPSVEGYERSLAEMRSRGLLRG